MTEYSTPRPERPRPTFEHVGQKRRQDTGQPPRRRAPGPSGKTPDSRPAQRPPRQKPRRPTAPRPSEQVPVSPIQEQLPNGSKKLRKKIGESIVGKAYRFMTKSPSRKAASLGLGVALVGFGVDGYKENHEIVQQVVPDTTNLLAFGNDEGDIGTFKFPECTDPVLEVDLTSKSEYLIYQTATDPEARAKSEGTVQGTSDFFPDIQEYNEYQLPAQMPWESEQSESDGTLESRKPVTYSDGKLLVSVCFTSGDEKAGTASVDGRKISLDATKFGAVALPDAGGFYRGYEAINIKFPTPEAAAEAHLSQAEVDRINNMMSPAESEDGTNKSIMDAIVFSALKGLVADEKCGPLMHEASEKWLEEYFEQQPAANGRDAVLTKDGIDSVSETYARNNPIVLNEPGVGVKLINTEVDCKAVNVLGDKK